MAKKTAQYKNYELNVEDNGKIVILHDGQSVANLMATLRDIASQVGFTLDPKWNTQSSGRKLIDFLNTLSSDSASIPVSRSESRPSSESRTTANPPLSSRPKTTSTPGSAHRHGPDAMKNEYELTEEEMKQIDDLMKRIEALEARIVKLESNQGANTNVTTDREVIIAHKHVTAGGSNNDYFKTSKNRVLLDCSPRYGMRDENYRQGLINALISIGDTMEPKANEPIETFVARIRAKYNPDPSLPTLLGGFVLLQNGTLWGVTLTNRSIKF